MWSWLASFLSGPIIKGVLDGYKAKLAAGNTTERIAADLAGRELAVQQREHEVNAERHGNAKWYEPEKLMGYSVAIYFGKLLVWDKVLKLGVTDPLTGDAAKWAALVVAFYFGKRTVESALRIWRAR
jgi:hypothetical protein